MKKKFSTLIASLIVGSVPLLGQETNPLNDPTNIDADLYLHAGFSQDSIRPDYDHTYYDNTSHKLVKGEDGIYSITVPLKKEQIINKKMEIGTYTYAYSVIYGGKTNGSGNDAVKGSVGPINADEPRLFKLNEDRDVTFYAKKVNSGTEDEPWYRTMFICDAQPLYLDGTELPLPDKYGITRYVVDRGETQRRWEYKLSPVGTWSYKQDFMQDVIPYKWKDNKSYDLLPNYGWWLGGRFLLTYDYKKLSLKVDKLVDNLQSPSFMVNGNNISENLETINELSLNGSVTTFVKGYYANGGKDSYNPDFNTESAIVKLYWQIDQFPENFVYLTNEETVQDNNYNKTTKWTVSEANLLEGKTLMAGSHSLKVWYESEYLGDVLTTEKQQTTFNIEGTISNYTRNVTTGDYGTICLPYAVQASDISGAVFFFVNGKKMTDGKPSSIVITEVENLEAGKPYIFQATADKIVLAYSGEEAAEAGSDNGFIGSFEGKEFVEGENPNGDLYILYQNKITRISNTKGGRIGANRAYFDLKQMEEFTGQLNAKQRVFSFNGGVTGIDNITVDADSLVDVYAVSGVRVRHAVRMDAATEGLPAGVYVVNGKKVVVK